MSRRLPISTPWRINRINLLGVFEVHVVDSTWEPNLESLAPERLLDVAAVRGFGDMARAAFIALVMSLGRGRSERELDRAMSPPAPREWLKRDSIHSHISAVRRTGLKVRLESQRYRVVDLEPEQVDALQLRKLRDRVRDLEPYLPAPGAVQEIIAHCQRAFTLWVGDPADAHPYLHDPRIFADDGRWYRALQESYVRALLSLTDIDAPARKAADETIEELRLGGVDVAELVALRAQRSRFRHGPRPATASSLPMASSRPGEELDWLPRYRDHLLGRVETIDLRLFGSELLTESPVESIYTPLYVTPRSSQHPLPKDQAEAGRPSLDAAAAKYRGLLVVGESGSGKSTFLRHLCLRHLHGGPNGQTGLVPLFFELVELSDATDQEFDGLGRLKPGAVTRTLASRLAADGIVVEIEDVEELSRTGKAIWLLDGLNEISIPEVRSAAAEAISGYVRRWRNARFVVTTTGAALATHGTPLGLTRVDIDDLRQADVETFITSFASTAFPELNMEQRRVRSEELAIRILSNADLRDLARTPLQLTAIAMMFFSEGWLPESRADLLQAAVSWSIRKRAPVLRSFARRGRDLQALFEELAFRMVAAADRPLVRAGRQWAARQIANAQVQVFEGNEKRSLDFLDAATAAGGLLTPRGRGDLGMHESVRNYLAASHIAGKTDDEVMGWWGILEPRLDDEEWRHILTLVPGCLLALGSERVDLFFDRLGQSSTGQPRAIRAARMALGGSVLRELTLAGYRLGNAPHWQQAVRDLKELFYVVTDLDPEVRHGAAMAFGLTGDDRLSDFNGTWAWLDGGQFLMGSQAVDPAGQNYDPDAAPWESPVRSITVQPFAIRKYPITVQEYRIFVEAGGYAEARCRWWSPGALEWRNDNHVTVPLEWEDQLLAPNTPVTGVSWFECEAYARWLCERLSDGSVYRLPFEREWEYAARRAVPPGQQFPWGNRMHAGREAEANWVGALLRRKTAVGLFPKSHTQDGVADLFGNVEEWCLDLWEENERESDARKAETTVPSRLAPAVIQRSAARHSAAGVRRVVRGGSCIRFSRLCRPSYRSRIAEHHRYLTVGFRLVRSSTSS